MDETYTTIKSKFNLYFGTYSTLPDLLYSGMHNVVPLKLWSAQQIYDAPAVGTSGVVDFLSGDADYISELALYRILHGDANGKIAVGIVRRQTNTREICTLWWYPEEPYRWTVISLTTLNAARYNNVAEIQKTLDTLTDTCRICVLQSQINQIDNGQITFRYIDDNNKLISSQNVYCNNSSNTVDFIGYNYEITNENPVDDDDDPYDDDGVSGGGGGEGTLDPSGDDVDFPDLPTLSAVDTGFITLFNPTISQMLALSSYMWSNNFDLDTFKKVIANPIDAILGLSIVPVRVPNGGNKIVTIGNVSTGISMNTAATQYVRVDCGSINVKEYWGAYLDYDPYTECSIYLPYIGVHPLKTDDIMGKVVHVEYHVDILSGACTAMIKCGNSVLYSYIGHCSSSIPITSNDWTNVINGVLGIAGSIGNMVASGGITAPSAVTSLASSAINASKPNIEKSGALGGTGGMLGVQTPYLIVTRPRVAAPAYQNTFMGYPSFITNTLSNLKGYTEIETIHLENIPATESELNEIENLLKAGVIL